MRYKYKNDLDTNTNEFCPADPEFYPASLWCPQEDYFIWGQVNINQRYHCGLYFNEQSVSDGMVRLTALSLAVTNILIWIWFTDTIWRKPFVMWLFHLPSALIVLFRELLTLALSTKLLQQGTIKQIDITIVFASWHMKYSKNSLIWNIQRLHLKCTFNCQTMQHCIMKP